MATKTKTKFTKDKIFTVPDAKPQGFYKQAAPTAAPTGYSTQKPIGSYATEYKGPGSDYEKKVAASAPISTAPKSLRELFKAPVRWIKNASTRKAEDGQMSYCLTGACTEIYGGDHQKYNEVLTKLNKVINAYKLAPNAVVGASTGTVVAFNDADTTTFLDIQRVVNLAEV